MLAPAAARKLLTAAIDVRRLWWADLRCPVVDTPPFRRRHPFRRTSPSTPPSLRPSDVNFIYSLTARNGGRPTRVEKLSGSRHYRSYATRCLAAEGTSYDLGQV